MLDELCHQGCAFLGRGTVKLPDIPLLVVYSWNGMTITNKLKVNDLSLLLSSMEGPLVKYIRYKM